jgi:hypothetical protein
MELRDLRADFRHDPADFMAKHGRCREDRIGGEEQVSVAEPGGSHVNQDLAPEGAAMSTSSKSNPPPMALSTSAFMCALLACELI